MIAMQRSLSSPSCTKSDSQANPSEVRSRSPTPSSPEKNVERPEMRSFNDRSPTRTAGNVSMSVRRSEEVPRWAAKLEQRPAVASGAQKPLVTQQPAISPQFGRDDSPPSRSAQPEDTVDRDESPTHSFGSVPPRARVPPLFLRDVTQYTNPQLAPDSNCLTLEELAHLVRLAKYQDRKRASTRVRLQRSLVSTALSARLTRCGESAHRNLVSCFRTNDKKAFASLYKAVHDVRLSCMETRKYAMLEPDMESLSLQSPGLASSETLSGMPGSTPSLVGSAAPFLNDILPSSKEAFLDFIAQLRNNPDYLAARLCSLNATELSALKTFDHNPEPIESVLPSSSSASSRVPSVNLRERTSILRSVSQRQLPSSATHVEQLLSFQRHDPLAALIHTCFANSAGPDSAEDRRRTDIWATALARLISERRTGNDSILFSVLNAWSIMRDWSGRSNMEWYLMKILEDGAFILDKAEDQNGTRFNLTAWTREDSHKSDRFYERAVEKLFEILDDEDDTGIPEGLVELGNEILRKLDPQFVEGARKGLIVNWLFHVWLLEVMIYPETRGMMAEYHITDYGRQKILKNVALKAAGLVNEKMSGRYVKPEIAKHIENILARFVPSHVAKPKTRLLPARSLTSLRETVEVHPYLLISPADLVTMVNALFPEKRPQSAQSSKFRSRAASILDFAAAPAQPMRVAGNRSNAANDGASIISTSLSSVFSDVTTSHEPLLEEQHTGNSGSRYSPPPPPLPKRVNTFEEDGFRLREAVHDLTDGLGQDVVQGTCHPCTERWAVLFISPDGNSLSTQMMYDPEEDENEDDERSPSSDTDDEDTEDGSLDLDKDYHQLRDSILRLVEDFEIPQERSASGKHAPTFSNRTYSTLKRYASRNRMYLTEQRRENRDRHNDRRSTLTNLSGKNPIHLAGTSEDLADEESLAQSSSNGSEYDNGESVLVAMLKAASAQARAQSDFVAAHDYWRTLQRLNSLSSSSLRSNGFAVLLNIFSRGPRGSIRRSASAIEEYDAWLVWLKQSQERTDGAIDSMMKRLAALRDKAWYVMDVLNSNPYDHSSKIATALKAMGSQPSTRPPLNQKSTKLAFLYTSESQMTDMLSGGKEYGFWNKLSDDHSEKTTKWLRHLNIENFCRGEERIHRLGLEVDICINKLVGDGATPAPELWTNDLYTVDRGSLDRNAPRERDWDDTSSIVSDVDRRYPGRFGSGIRDLRSVSSFNMSQHSFDSGRFSFSRASGAAMSEALDSQSYFGASSPVHTIDSTVTYWSQFQSAISTQGNVPRAQSPTTSFTSLSGSVHLPQTYNTLRSHKSTTSLRPGTSASSNETVLMQRLSEEKTRFLARLRQTLTSLLLSDLGNLVFARGSEADLWFRDLGQRCIKHRDAVDLNQQQTASVHVEKKRPKDTGGLRRAIEKKRSFENLREAGENPPSSAVEDGGAKLATLPLDSNITLDANVDAIPASLNITNNAPSKTATSAVPPLKPRRKTKSSEFPFTKAYQRLLRMFCVHPNPMVKLDALYELEQLIVASLATNGSRKRPGLAQRGSSGSGQHTVAGNMSPAAPSPAKPLERTIDNLKERRSHTMGLRSHLATTFQSHSDAIVNVLRSLFRDAAVRPKTLFRDLQFIASFVPASVLDQTDKGMAFWNVGLAALLLKQEVCGTIVEMADEILKKTGNSNAVKTASNAATPSISSSSTSSTSSPPSPVTSTLSETATKKDAERMWIITAKEGHPTAQRELALFYLIEDPSEFDVEKATLPLSKISELLRQQVLDNYATWRKGGESGTKAVRMCLAIHWAAAAAEGGDGIARDFIKQQDDHLGLVK